MNPFSDFGESNIFKNEEALSAEYAPELLPHRENEIKQIADNIKPAARGQKPQNTFLYGPPGIGKTAVAKCIFREFEEYSDRVKCIYVNCWDFRTPAALLTQLVLELGVFIQRRGLSRDEIMGRLVEAIDKRTKSVIVCLDEVDQLDMEALYDLLRINQYVKAPLGIIFISNNPHVFAKAEPRIRSSLDLDEVEFKSYTLEEMKDILSERAELAFHSFDPVVVTLCASSAVSRGGDVRIGLQYLMKAGRAAEQKNARKVSVLHAKDALKAAEETAAKETAEKEKKEMPKETPKEKILKGRITVHERLLLEALKNGKKVTSGKLYAKYRELAKRDASVSETVSDRSLRGFVNHLKELGLIEISKKKIGKSRLIWRVFSG